MKFTVAYSPLFASIVLLCSVYALFLVLYVNDKAQHINVVHRMDPSKDAENENELMSQRQELMSLSKKIMLYLLILDLLINVILIIVKGYYTLIGITGGLVLPVAGYFVFLFFLMFAVGLKGQKPSFITRFFKGLD